MITTFQFFRVVVKSVNTELTLALPQLKKHRKNRPEWLTVEPREALGESKVWIHSVAFVMGKDRKIQLKTLVLDIKVNI